MHRNRRFISPACLLVLVCCLGACSEAKVEPAPDSGFLAESDRLKPGNKLLPFQRSWIKDPNRHEWCYHSVMIADVDTTHLESSSWTKELEPKSEIDIRRDAKKIAVFMKTHFERAVAETKPRKYHLVEQSEACALIVELALVELVPTNAYINGVANLAGFFVPGSQLVELAGGAALQTGGAVAASGSIAIEGRLRDGGTREVIAMFADRRMDKVAPIDLAGLTWYSHAHDEIEDWADEVNEWISSPADHKVSEPSRFTLLPW